MFPQCLHTKCLICDKLLYSTNPTYEKMSNEKKHNEKKPNEKKPNEKKPDEK